MIKFRSVIMRPSSIYTLCFITIVTHHWRQDASCEFVKFLNSLSCQVYKLVIMRVTTATRYSYSSTISRIYNVCTKHCKQCLNACIRYSMHFKSLFTFTRWCLANRILVFLYDLDFRSSWFPEAIGFVQETLVRIPVTITAALHFFLTT